MSDVSYSAPEEPGTSSGVERAAAATRTATAQTDGDPVQPNEPVQNQPLVKTGWEKTPRNAPCPCGSGKKFKLCHGKA